MGIDLLLIFSFQDKDNLYRDEVVGIITVWQNQRWGRIHRNLSRVLARIGISLGDTAETWNKPRRCERRCLYRRLVSS